MADRKVTISGAKLPAPPQGDKSTKLLHLGPGTRALQEPVKIPFFLEFFCQKACPPPHLSRGTMGTMSKTIFPCKLLPDGQGCT